MSNRWLVQYIDESTLLISSITSFLLNEHLWNGVLAHIQSIVLQLLSRWTEEKLGLGIFQCPKRSKTFTAYNN